MPMVLSIKLGAAFARHVVRGVLLDMSSSNDAYYTRAIG
jgi:hypothetical protein